MTKANQQQQEWQQLAYGAALVERMYPNYSLFAELTGSGDAAAFRNILNLVWEFASGRNRSIDFQKQLDKLEQITPDPKQFDVYGVWPALDATVALASLLSCCDRADAAEIRAIETLSQSTISHYLQAIGQEQDEALLQVEAACCEQLKRAVAASGSDRLALVADLKQLIADYGVSNIGLEPG